MAWLEQAGKFEDGLCLSSTSQPFILYYPQDMPSLRSGAGVPRNHGSEVSSVFGSIFARSWDKFYNIASARGVAAEEGRAKINQRSNNPTQYEETWQTMKGSTAPVVMRIKHYRRKEQNDLGRVCGDQREQVGIRGYYGERLGQQQGDNGKRMLKLWKRAFEMDVILKMKTESRTQQLKQDLTKLVDENCRESCHRSAPAAAQEWLSGADKSNVIEDTTTVQSTSARGVEDLSEYNIWSCHISTQHRGYHSQSSYHEELETLKVNKAMEFRK
ncbi:hypothetical protein B0H17DRAFT_1130332 [Mycena rosella]|uniref:Uncharacterized protein n=1 Tax=Mycena rosella TaxID=1033263 RepID=A0AAD7DQG5_MYCRO|nr:hypothetical protein B0H17DRAFT_1130332 [Mycena rosella]